MDMRDTNGKDTCMTTPNELLEIKNAVRDFRRIDIVLSRCSVDELAEIVDKSNHLLHGFPLRWVAATVAKELDRREQRGSEPGMVRLPIDRVNVSELCRLNQSLRVWLRTETNPNVRDFLDQVFGIAMCNLNGRFQALHEATQ